MATDLITSIAQAIIRMENVNPRYNNPGAIFDTSKNQLRTYPTYEAGYAALLNQVRLNVNRGLTLEEFFGGKPGVYPGYAPVAPGIHSTNDPQNYANNVASWTGIPLGVPIKDVVSIGSPAPPTSVASNPTGGVSPGSSGGFTLTLPDLTSSFGDAWDAGADQKGTVATLALLAMAGLGLYLVMRG